MLVQLETACCGGKKYGVLVLAQPAKLPGAPHLLLPHLGIEPDEPGCPLRSSTFGESVDHLLEGLGRRPCLFHPPFVLSSQHSKPFSTGPVAISGLNL